MFLARPCHEIRAYTGMQIPYTTKLFYNLCNGRDKFKCLAYRLSYEIGFIGVGLLASIESVIRMCFSLIYSTEKLSKGWKICNLTILYSIYATAFNLFVQNLTHELIHYEWYLYKNFKNQFLFNAFEFGRKDLIEILHKEYKADPHDIHCNPNDKEKISPALIPHLIGNKALFDMFSLSDFEKKYLDLKILAHWLSLTGNVKLCGEEIPLEGTCSAIFSKSISERLNDFSKSYSFNLVNLPLEKIELLEKAFADSYYEQSFSAIANRIQRNKLTFISTGWERHGICLCFMGNYLAIGNRGEIKQGKSTIEVYKIDPKKVRETLIEDMRMHEYMPRQYGEKFFYETLPAVLSLNEKPCQDFLCRSFQSIVPSKPRWGTCALTSKKAALRFAWAMLLSEKPTKETLEQAKFESKLFTCWTAWKMFKESPFLKELKEDKQFISQMVEKGNKKIAKCQKISSRLALGFIPGIIRRSSR